MCQMSINWWNKLWHANIMEYCSSYKGTTYWYMQHHNDSRALCSVKEARFKRQHTIWSHSYDVWKRENYRDRNPVSTCWMAEGRGSTKRYEDFFFFVIEILCILVFAMVKTFAMANCIRLSKFIELFILKEWILLYVNYTSINFLKILKGLGR